MKLLTKQRTYFEVFVNHLSCPCVDFYFGKFNLAGVQIIERGSYFAASPLYPYGDNAPREETLTFLRDFAGIEREDAERALHFLESLCAQVTGKYQSFIFKENGHFVVRNLSGKVLGTFDDVGMALAKAASHAVRWQNNYHVFDVKIAKTHVDRAEITEAAKSFCLV